MMNVPESYKSKLLFELNTLGLDDVWNLRSNIQMLKNYILQNCDTKDELVLKHIEDLLDVSNDLFKYLTSIKGCVSSADYNKLARLLDTGGEAIKAIEEIISSEDLEIGEILMSGLSLVLNYVGDTAYITSALEGCETQVSANSMIVYDRLWQLVHTYNSDASPIEIANVTKSLETFSKKLSNRNIPAA